MASREEMSLSFGSATDDYRAGRPTYPLAAVRWMLEPVGEHPFVADVGAGTGKLTAVIAEAGAGRLVAVDPDAAMLDALRGDLPDVETRAGTGERLPFDDGELDAAVFGQSWHWVDPEAGSREVARAVRPGGVFGLIWNIRDDRHEWVRRMTEIMHTSNAEQALAAGGPDVRAPFNDVRVRRFEWTVKRTREQLFAMARSRSFLITASDDERSRIETDLTALFDEVGAVGDARVDLPYVTSAFRAIRPE